MLKVGTLYISWSFFALLFFVLLFEMEMLAVCMLPGVVVHEAGHWIMLKLNGRQIKSLTVFAGGMKIIPEGSNVSLLRQLAEILGGCGFSFLFAWAFAGIGGSFWSAAAGFSFVLGFFNMLPCRGLDGGSAVEVLFDRFTGHGDLAVNISSAVVSLLLVVLGVVLYLRGYGLLPVAAGIFQMAKVGVVAIVQCRRYNGKKILIRR